MRIAYEGYEDTITHLVRRTRYVCVQNTIIIIRNGYSGMKSSVTYLNDVSLDYRIF
jgi:hypothetical protein